MSKTLLLDFDGVILKNKVIERKLSRKIERYCGDTLKIDNKRLSRKMNRELYLSSGHSLLGLKKIGVPQSLKQFNEKIYNFNYNELYENITDENIEDIRKIIDLKLFCQSQDISLKIWSNSPSQWCRSLINYMTHELSGMEIVDNQNCIYLLKPEKDSYEYIEYKCRGDIIFFVDDKLSNFFNVLNNRKWVSIYYTSEEECEKNCNNMWTINDLSHIKDILNKYSSFKI